LMGKSEGGNIDIVGENEKSGKKIILVGIE
jgi:hypothetical protein